MNPHHNQSSSALKGQGLATESKIQGISKYFARIFLPKHKVLVESTEQFPINPPRKTLIIQFFVLLFTAAILGLLSIGALAYVLFPVWLYLFYCVYAFAKLCHLYGYSSTLVTILYLILAIPLVLILNLIH